MSSVEDPVVEPVVAEVAKPPAKEKKPKVPKEKKPKAPKSQIPAHPTYFQVQSPLILLNHNYPLLVFPIPISRFVLVS